MAGLIKTHIQIGDSTTPANNFTLSSAAVDGTLSLTRGNFGSPLQPIFSIAADGKLTLQGITDLADASLTGVPTAPTAATGTNTTQLATTGFVIGERTVVAAAVQTLTNKTLTAPVINGGTINGFSGTGNGVITGTLGVSGRVDANSVGTNIRVKADGTDAKDNIVAALSNGNMYLGNWNSPAVRIDNGSAANTVVVSSTGLAVTGSVSAVGSGVGGTQISYSAGGSNKTGYLYSDTLGVGFTASAATGFSEGVYLNPTAKTVQIYTNALVQATLNASGNLGLGAPPSAWYAASGFRALQLGQYGFTSLCDGGSAYNSRIMNNSYYNASGVATYVGNYYASEYSQVGGSHQWRSAPSGTGGNEISFGAAKMTLDANGLHYLTNTNSSGEAYAASKSFADDANTSRASFGMNAFATGVAYSPDVSRVDGARSGWAWLGRTANAANEVNDYMVLKRISAGGSVSTPIVIDSGGNTDIGYFTAARAKLNVRGYLHIQGAATSNSGDIVFHRNDNGSKTWAIGTNDSALYLFDSDASHYAYLTQNPTAWQWSSDRRIKKDIVNLEYGLAEVLVMRPTRYTFTISGKNDIGFIAQELQLIIPEAVSGTEIEFLDTDTPQERAAKTLGVGKETLIPILVKAIQEQQAMIAPLPMPLNPLITGAVSVLFVSVVATLSK